MYIVKIHLITCISIAILLSACNRTSEPKTTEPKTTKPTATEQNTAQIVPKSKLDCQKISPKMTAVNSQTKLDLLNQINTQLKQCVAQANNAQQLKWIQQSTQMYQQFLSSKNTEQQYAAFEDYGYHLLNIPSKNPDDENSEISIDLNPDVMKKLSTRDQYLIQNNGKSYIDLQYVGEGIFNYRRQPQYLVDIFAQHLPKDQREFLERMAKDNQEILFSDAAITVSWSELATRALFWEKYLQQYPKGHFYKNAQNLFNEYSYFLFLGTDNTPVSDEFAPDTWMNEEALITIRQLAKTDHTVLAEKAKKFLTYIKTPIDQRNIEFNINPLDKEGNPKDQNRITHEQLQQLLKLRSPWEREIYDDCHTDAICISYAE